MPLYIQYPEWIDPYVIDGFPVRWYAVMYIVAFAVAYGLYHWQLKKEAGFGKEKIEEAQNLFFWAVVGLLIGAHLFSILFYSDTSYYLSHPWLIFWPFRDGKFVGLPGMSYHGGVVGALVGGIIYARKRRMPFLWHVDRICAGIPLGYTFGRIGNFINGELYGRATTRPWGMVFPAAPSYSTSEEWVRTVADAHGIEYSIGDMVNLPRHPSQLYEAFAEGLLLFLVLWFVARPLMKKYRLRDGSMLSFYVFGYGFARFFIEYCRQPDANIGYVISGGPGADNIALFGSFLNISKGQVFCFLMMVSAVILFFVVNRRRPVQDVKGNNSRKARRPARRNGK